MCVSTYTRIHISENLSDVPSKTQVSIFAIYLVTVAFIFNGKTWMVPADSTVLQALPG